ncbi:DNA repair protein RadA/Sms [Desulfotomaculum arcticum]|uniref:DNA repair protein RadA n=1 Tax=Desulfotruncus arcticus DSM 17038 TaxID=1121424 RepID=A0A1I2VZB1_9FIRM|nr:DNA repair protein RadA [Desulfotruncus arcticus]SFG94474.1 DNA repair protein RadA/Sms [Desulfotomaculum arcticum] [Desulfotruncus arcticus DSM 17038]
MSAKKTRYFCNVCGHITSRWLGRCAGCGEWNTYVEEVVVRGTSPRSTEAGGGNRPLPVTEVAPVEGERNSTGMAELDRVLGGGLVPGSLVLLGGDPGIGKSTLLLQVAGLVGAAGKKVLYVSGEESVRQIRLRADRLEISCPGLYAYAETDLQVIEEQVNLVDPALLVIDSIQTMYGPDITSAAGSVSQVRECTARLMRLAKERSLSIFVIGHVTKEGMIAGPRVMEHMVDVVLYFEGERNQSFRILRGVKNRFGSTNEIGIYEMSGYGLKEVINPSSFFLDEHAGRDVAGAVVVPVIEGTRPLLVEIQSLVCPTSFGVPRRMTAGVDHNRTALIIAVLEKRLGLMMGNCDAYVNVVGGVKIDEPAADLGVAAALTSSFRERVIDHHTCVMGELGLTGELRPVAALDKRIREAARLGFKRCIVPQQKGIPDNVSEVKIFEAKTLADAFDHMFV